MELVIILLMIWVGYLTVKLNSHSRDLERIGKTLSKFRVVKKDASHEHTEERENTSSEALSKAAEHPSGEVPSEVPAVEVKAPEEEQASDASFEYLLIKRILPSMGVLSVILGLGYFVTWSYTNNWIGPGTLIAMGVLFSASLVGLGEYTRKRYARYYAYFSGAGMLGLAVCVYASHHFYGFIGDSLAFSAYCVIIVSSFGFALRYQNRLLSFLSGAGSFVVPFLIHSEDPGHYVLMGYGALVFLGGALIMRLRNWTEANGANGVRYHCFGKFVV